MAKDSDDTKPTIEDVDRVIREHERKDVARQDIKKATEERIAKGQEASQDVHFKELCRELGDALIRRRSLLAC